MKFSNRLPLFLAGVVFCPFRTFSYFTNPVANLVAYSWWIAFGFTGFFYSSYFRLFLCTKRASAHQLIFSKGLLIFS